jgi:hypothetical protein
MKEIYEFRILNEHADILFEKNEGKDLGSVRKIFIQNTDPRFYKIHELQRKYLGGPGYFFYSSWNISRKYTKRELEAATLFKLIIQSSAYFEPEGEDCGTVYDDGPACAQCGAGGVQVGPLFLDVRRIPKSKDIAMSIANELVVSQRLVDLFAEHQVTGARFEPVQRKNARNPSPSGWHHLVIEPPCAEIVAPTRAGASPFECHVVGEGGCPRGDTIGLNLISEVTVSADGLPQADIMLTRQFVGRRQGVLRPRRMVLVSQKVRQILARHRLKGCRLEVAHIASAGHSAETGA